MRSDAERRSDVRAVLAAGQMIAERANDGTIAADIAASCGLSEASVKYALGHCLERDASDAELDEVFAWVGATQGEGEGEGEVGVILPAGVFTAAVRALALAFAAGTRVVLRPSRRDPRFAELLFAALADPRLRLVTELDVQSYKGSEIHVYGRDATVADVRARASVPVRSHGHGFGIAFVGETSAANAEEIAAALADDVVAFDQRGCLSPRSIFVVGERSAATLARALDVALSHRERALPRGEMSSDERAAIARYAEVIAFAGTLHRGAAHLVGVAGAKGAFVLPPVGRNVHLVPVDSASAAREAIADVARFVTTVGTNDAITAAELGVPNARLSRLGRMQRPPFDGPVDRRPG